MMPACKYGDPLCPCQDGDMCHYEGPDAMKPPKKHRDLETIMDELTWECDALGAGGGCGEQKERLIREMNNHPDIDRYR